MSTSLENHIVGKGRPLLLLLPLLMKINVNALHMLYSVKT